MPQLYVLSLGGSLIVPDDLDQKFLKQFRALIIKQIRRGHRFIIVTGGGQTSRKYTTALRGVAPVSSDDLDWMGIAATRMNAKLVQLMFKGSVHPMIIQDPNKKITFREKILIAGGWKPGRSSDDDAVRLAHAYGSSTIINLSNVDYVYDKDPRKYKTARKIETIAWTEYFKMFGAKWNPGLHAPFDPTAARSAKRYDQKVIIANGRDLKNVERILAGKKFKGTEINKMRRTVGNDSPV